jgi:hypothetical protein
VIVTAGRLRHPKTTKDFIMKELMLCGVCFASLLSAATANASQPPVYFGRVRNDVGSLFAVQNGSATYIEQQSWESCPAGYHTVGKVFHSNGFWLCAPDNTTHRYWVGNVLNDHGYYYSFTPGFEPTAEGEEHWDVCRTGSLIGHLFDSNGFWVCQE